MLSPEIFIRQKDALESIKKALPGNGWVELAEDVTTADDGVDYQVAVNNNGEYELCDRAGVPFKNIKPASKVGDPNAPTMLVKRLIHLAKYHATAELDNADKDSSLFAKLAVEWLGTSNTYERGDLIPKKSQPEPIDDPIKPTVKVGEHIFLSIRNTSSQPLNIAVLNLESDWAIKQIYPYKPTELFITLDPSQEGKIAFEPLLEGNSSDVENTIKVFATVGPANFRCLELPSLD